MSAKLLTATQASPRHRDDHFALVLACDIELDGHGGSEPGPGDGVWAALEGVFCSTGRRAVRASGAGGWRRLAFRCSGGFWIELLQREHVCLVVTHDFDCGRGIAGRVLAGVAGVALSAEPGRGRRTGPLRLFWRVIAPRFVALALFAYAARSALRR